MKKLISNGALVLLLSHALSACSFLPKFSEPDLGAARAGSFDTPYEQHSAITIGGVLFDTEAATLKPEAHKAVSRAVVYMLDNPDSEVVVEGHTDHTGSESFNQMLSEMRAGTIVRVLRSAGISADRITSIGYGETRPVADNNSPAGRQANRRVDLIFTEGAEE